MESLVVGISVCESVLVFQNLIHVYTTHLSELRGARVNFLCNTWCIGVKLCPFNRQRNVTQGFETTYLPRIEKAEWVDRPLDGLHQFNRPIPKLFVQVLFLSYTNTMFSGTYVALSRLNQL